MEAASHGRSEPSIAAASSGRRAVPAETDGAPPITGGGQEEEGEGGAEAAPGGEAEVKGKGREQGGRMADKAEEVWLCVTHLCLKLGETRAP